MRVLRFDGVNDFVTASLSSNVNWGTGAYAIEFGMIVHAFPSTGNNGILGTTASTTTGITLRQASGDGALAVLTSGTHRYSSQPGLVILNEYHVYRLEHDAGGAFRWYRDGVQFGPQDTFSSSTSVSSTIVFGRANSGGGFTQMDLEYCTTTGFTNAARWDASLTGSTGSVLATIADNNNGTLFNFPTDESQWVTLSGDTPVTFLGPVPVQRLTQNAVYSQDLSGFYSGTLTPFTYAVTGGALPTGVTLNPSTGLLSGTPTVQGKFPSVVVSATDTASNVANSNAFNVGVGPWALRFSTDNQFVNFASWSVDNGVPFELEFRLYRTSGTAYLTAPTSGFSNFVQLTATQLVFRENGNQHTKPAVNANGSYSVVKITRDAASTISAEFNGVSLGVITESAVSFDIGQLGRLDALGSRMDLTYARLSRAGDVRTYTADTSNVFQTTTFTAIDSASQGTMFNFTAASWVNVPLLVPAVTQRLKYHNGTAWVAKPLKYHNGTAWVEKTLKRHNGTTWS